MCRRRFYLDNRSNIKLCYAADTKKNPDPGNCGNVGMVDYINAIKVLINIFYSDSEIVFKTALRYSIKLVRCFFKNE